MATVHDIRTEAPARRLNPAELDDLLRQQARDEARAIARRNRIPRLPIGCDAQGRHPEAAPTATPPAAPARRDESQDLSTATGILLGACIGLGIWFAAAMAMVMLFWPRLFG